MSMVATPPSAGDLLASSFLENRARLIEIAAFLDRIDRYPQAQQARQDHRYRAVTAALEILSDGGGSRAARILHLLSDPGVDPAASAAPLPPVCGAWRDDVR